MSLTESEPITAPIAARTAVPAPVVLPAHTAAPDTTGPGPAPIWHGRGLVYACILGDALALFAAVALVLLTAGPDQSVGAELLLLPPLAGVMLFVRGTYSWGIGRSPLDAAGRAIGAVATAAMIVVVLDVATGSDPDLSSAALAATLGVLGLVSARALLAAGRRRAFLRNPTGDPALIVGAGLVGQRIAQRLLGDPTYGLQPVGFIDGTVPDVAPPLPVLGTIDDVRAVAASRRAGFSKGLLSSSLEDAGIEYVHLRDLGTPKEGRMAARRGRTAEMRAIFEAHLAEPAAQVQLARAIEIAKTKKAALLCYEADHGGCHRSIVVEHMLEAADFAVENLTPSTL